MSVKSEAAKDAAEHARAQMFFGEGAGTRRKLIKAKVNHKMDTVPGYTIAFGQALAAQDMADHAKAATRERKAKDVKKKVERNARGLINGNKESLTAGVAVVSTVGYFMHQNGYDKAVMDYTKKKYYKSKAYLNMKYKTHKAKKGPNLHSV